MYSFKAKVNNSRFSRQPKPQGTTNKKETENYHAVKCQLEFKENNVDHLNGFPPLRSSVVIQHCYLSARCVTVYRSHTPTCVVVYGIEPRADRHSGICLPTQRWSPAQTNMASLTQKLTHVQTSTKPTLIAFDASLWGIIAQLCRPHSLRCQSLGNNCLTLQTP